MKQFIFLFLNLPYILTAHLRSTFFLQPRALIENTVVAPLKGLETFIPTANIFYITVLCTASFYAFKLSPESLTSVSSIVFILLERDKPKSTFKKERYQCTTLGWGQHWEVRPNELLKCREGHRKPGETEPSLLVLLSLRALFVNLLPSKHAATPVLARLSRGHTCRVKAAAQTQKCDVSSLGREEGLKPGHTANRSNCLLQGPGGQTFCLCKRVWEK